MDNPNVLKSLNSKPNKDDYKMKEFKFFKAPNETPNINNNEAQKEICVKRYDCPNCQGCGCTTCAGFGYLEY